MDYGKYLNVSFRQINKHTYFHTKTVNKRLKTKFVASNYSSKNKVKNYFLRKYFTQKLSIELYGA